MHKTIYVIRRKDGKYFRGPAQFEHFMWWPDIEEAMKFHSMEAAERLRRGREMGDGTEIVPLSETKKPGHF
ncbi:hypothetical protein [Hyphomicrobium sp. DY-1]|uniref:hypothetical protein n=1 Tax=Hyphomicrobium sp. DY-1 TaxID=3075650 RepID=UPI0039C4C3ED